MENTWRFPPGFRFHPTDEELVLDYLKRKAFSFPLPATIIPEIDFRSYDPWTLPGVGQKESYFFHLRGSKYVNGCGMNRAMGSGYWKAMGKEKAIVGSKISHVVGFKKALVFYLGKVKTCWFMHEYRLAGDNAGSSRFGKKNKLVHRSVNCHNNGEWVLCRIFRKEKGSDRDCTVHTETKEKDQINGDSLSYGSCSSDLSCVTESKGDVSSPGYHS